MHQPPHARLPAGLQQRPRPLHGDGIHAVHVLVAGAHLRGGMEDHLHPRRGFRQRFGMPQVSQGMLHRQRLQHPRVAGGAVEGAHTVPRFHQRPAERRPNETR